MIIAALILTLLLTGGGADDTNDAYRHYLRANYYLQYERPLAALDELQLVIDADPKSATPRVTLARILLVLNRRDEALAALEKASELDPGDTGSLRLIGRIYLQKAAMPNEQAKNLHLAEQSFQRALELNPEDQESLFFLALIYDQTGMIDEAIGVKERLLLLNPSMRDVWLSLANDFARRGDQEGELNALERALEADPENADLLIRAGEAAGNLRRYRQAFAHFDNARERLEEQTWTSAEEKGLHLQLAQLCLWNTGQYDIALNEFEQVIELAESGNDSRALEAEARIGKATCLFYMGDFKPASELFERYEEVVLTQQTRSVIQMILSYAGAEKWQRAQEIIDRLRMVFQDSARAASLKRLRAQVLNQADRGEEADLILEELIAQNPDDEDNLISLFQLKLDRKEYDSARGVLLRLEAMPGDSERRKYFWGLLQWQTGDLNSARANFEAVIERDPLDHQTLNNLGYMLTDRGTDLEVALGYIRRALEMQPYQGSYLDSLGWTYFKMGNLQLAEKYLKASARTRYRSAEVREHLGYLYLALGRPAEALAEFQAALDLDLASLKSTADVEDEIARLQQQLEDQR